METKYGPFPDETLKDYNKRLISKVFKLLPFKEEGYPTIDGYIVSLIFEMKGYFSVIDKPTLGMEIVSVLEQLRSEEVFAVYRREVFHAINLIEKSDPSV